MSTAVAPLLLAGAVLAWPVAPGTARVVRRARPRLAAWRPRGHPLVVLAAAALLGGLLAGPGGTVAATLLTATLRGLRRRAVRDREGDAATAGLAEALASFAAEIRSGAPPAAAARSAGDDAHPVAARAMALVEATSRLGGDVPTALRAAASREAAARGHLGRLAAAWSLAERHGIALAGPLAAAAADLRVRARVAGGLRAQLAGPRATAAVLAGLPVLGVGLGEGIGARPWSVLSATGPGQVLLVVGVGLVCAGLWWTARIVAGVAR